MDKKMTLPLKGPGGPEAVSTIVRFQVSGFGRKQKESREAEALVASQRKAAKFLRNRPSGSYILRFAKDCLWTKRASPLFLSLKFEVGRPLQPGGGAAWASL